MTLLEPVGIRSEGRAARRALATMGEDVPIVHEEEDVSVIQPKPPPIPVVKSEQMELGNEQDTEKKWWVDNGLQKSPQEVQEEAFEGYIEGYEISDQDR